MAAYTLDNSCQKDGFEVHLDAAINDARRISLDPAIRDRRNNKLFISVFGGEANQGSIDQVSGYITNVAAKLATTDLFIICDDNFIVTRRRKYRFWEKIAENTRTTPPTPLKGWVYCREDPGMRAVTLHGTGEMILCPPTPINHSGDYRTKTMSYYLARNLNGQPIDKVGLSISTLIFHELLHWANQGIVRDWGYYWAEVVDLGLKRPDRAVRNADSLAYYAVGCFLDKYDWFTGFGQRRT